MISGRFAGVVAAVAALILPGTASAIPAVAAETSGLIDGTFLLPPDCGRTFDVGMTVSCNRISASGARFGARARADTAGRLRGEALAQHDAAAARTFGAAGASWTDRVEFKPFATPVTGVIWLRMNGIQAATTNGDGSAPAARTTAIMRLMIYRDDSFTPAGSDEVILRRVLTDFGPFETHRLGQERKIRGVSGGFTEVPVDPLQTTFDLAFEFEIDPGLSRIWFNWRFNAIAEMISGYMGFSFVRYFTTASILGFQFVDPTGKDITSEADPVFPSGQPYPVGRPDLDVPAPASAAVLAAALGLLGGLLRRRSQAADQTRA